MSSQFIGLDVRLTLHSQPGSSLQAKILSIDQAANTLTVQKQDGAQAVLKRTDIASLAACKPAQSAPKSASEAPARSDTSSPVKAQSKKTKHQLAEGAAPTSKPATAQPSAPSLADPAIMSFNRSTDSVAEQHAARHLLAPLQASDPAGSRSSTPSRSPRPKHALPTAPTPKSSKKKQSQAPASRGSSPAIPNASLSDDFDFTAGLKAFDKKKIWDDIRASDHTDPASLLVSHNRISNGTSELVRGPNGVGPANSFSTPDRGRSSMKDGQQKLRPNEMVCSPSPERAPSPPPAQKSPLKAVEASRSAATAATGSDKPTYEQLEEKVKKLEAELALARRRNVLLEELAGLGLGVPTRADATLEQAVSSPLQLDTNINKAAAQQTADSPAISAVADAEKSLSALSLQPQPSQPDSSSSTPASLSNALTAAGFAVSASQASAHSTPASTAPSTAAESKEAETQTEEPLFGHIVDPPVLTLLFPTAALQHAALARMEAFYESDSNAKRYLSLQEAADERICRNYQGFNFPIRQGVHEWLDAMFEATDSDQDSLKWWIPHCSMEEIQLLDLLVSLGAISPFEGASSRNADGEHASVTYVISCVASQAHSTLPHELLHALYFLSPTYRAFVSSQYASLSPANKKVIETDLGLRKYSPSVFQDEFQAYLAEGLGTEKEFGNKPAAECKEIAAQLRAQVAKEWKKLGLDLESGKQQERWEEVKWQTLDRYAAVQKASKKAAGVKAKGGKKSKK